MPSPTGKVALMSFIGALNFYTKFIENYILTSNHFTIFYMRTLVGNGQTNTKVFSKNLKCLSLLKHNLQYQIQNIHFSLQLTLPLLD